LYPAQDWFIVDLQKPIEISNEYGEGIKDICQEMRGFNGDGLYALVTQTDALPVTMVTSNTNLQQEHLQCQRLRRRFAPPVSF
jgi:hypothetical protein